MSLQWYPGHMTKARRELFELAPSQHVIIEVLDARMPKASSNPLIAELARQKPRICVLTKSDLADPAATDQWVKYLEAQGGPLPGKAEASAPPAASSSVPAPASTEPGARGEGIEGIEGIEGGHGQQAIVGAPAPQPGAPARKPPRPRPPVLAIAVTTERQAETRALVVAACKRLGLYPEPNKRVRALIAGVPNVGKSSLINTLMQQNVAKVGDKPAVTKVQQQAVLKSGLVLTDSPGMMWPKIEDESGALRLGFAGSIPDTAVDYFNLAVFGAKVLLERYGPLLVARFKLDAVPATPTALLEEVGRRRGALRSGGVVDLHKASEILVREFRSGGIGRITLELPPIALT